MEFTYFKDKFCQEKKNVWDENLLFPDKTHEVEMADLRHRWPGLGACSAK